MTLLLWLAIGQWGGSSCGLVQAAPLAIQRPAFVEHFQRPLARNYNWYGIEHEGLRFRVWGYANEVGNIVWDQDLAENRMAWEAARKPARPVEPVKPLEPLKPTEPAKKKEEAVVGPNFGLDMARIGHTPGYTSNKPYAPAIYGDKAGERFHLTVIGDPESRRQVKADFNGEPWAEYKDDVWFAEFAPGDWQVDDSLGYDGRGKPTVLLQDSSGLVLYRAYDYADGPEPIIRALRKANPHYRPERDPGPTRSSDPVFTPGRMAFGLLAGLILFAFLPRRKT